MACSVDVEIQGETVRLRVAGCYDSTASRAVRDLLTAVAAEQYGTVVVDLSGTTDPAAIDRFTDAPMPVTVIGCPDRRRSVGKHGRHVAAPAARR